MVIITHTNGSDEGRVFSAVCMFVFFLQNISKTDAARLTKLDTEMFHDESWKSIYFGVKRSMVKVTKALPAWVFALLRVLVASSLDYDKLCNMS